MKLSIKANKMPKKTCLPRLDHFPPVENGNPQTVFWKSQSGFSLTEILVVIVIIGILVLLALPNLENVIGKAKQTEARLQLKHLHTLQKAYYYENDRYCDNLEQLGFQQEKLVGEGGNARYRIELVEAKANTFQARAVSVVDEDRDGNYNTWEVEENGKIRQIQAD